LSDGESDSISISYAQKKTSLWESGQLRPTQNELTVISELLGILPRELEESFSTGVLPTAAADLIRLLSTARGQGLIASCFAGRVRPKLFPEDEDALREAINSKVSVAIFFSFPLGSTASAKAEYADALTHQHRDVWRSVVKFWKMLRSFSQESTGTAVKLYRPIVGSANVLFPPIFHRPTLLCERLAGRTKVDLYNWAQGSEHDGFYTMTGRSVEDTQFQSESWELYFGGIYERWNETGQLADGDSYWQAYTGQTETETDQP
jgi:hypothetical protein